MLARFLKIRAVQVGLVLHVVIAIALSFFALFDVLGFERAFVSGLIATPITATIAISLTRQARERSERSVARIALEATGIGLVMLTPTAFAGLAVELIRQPCNPGEGLVFLLITAGVSTVFGAGLGVASAVLTHRRVVPGALITLLLLGSLASSLFALYAEPQVFAYSVPFGYWPGSLYDERVEITAALAGHRGMSLLLGLTLVALAHAITHPKTLTVSRDSIGPRSTIAFIALAISTHAMHRSGESLGFDRTRATVERALSRHVETDAYEIFVDPSIDKRRLDRLKIDVELRMKQLVRFFGRKPSQKFRIYVYRDVNQKRAMMGAARTQIAKPWSGEIHIHGFDSPHRVLKHELAHLFGAEIASGAFGVPGLFGVFPNIGVIEGLAVAADWPTYHSMTVHEWTRAMRELNLAPDVRRMLYPSGFWAVSSSRAYTVAGSFLRFLYEEHGIEKLAVLYSSNDFSSAYGRSLDELASDWETFIDAESLPKGNLLIAEHRFKQPGIFQKACAHTVAQLSNDGFQSLGSGDLATAEAKLEQVFRYNPYRTDALLGLAKGNLLVGDIERARALIERAAKAAVTSKSRGQALGAEADLAWRLGDLDRARDGFRNVLALHLSDASDRLFRVKLEALDRPEETQKVLRDYLLGELTGGREIVKLGALSDARPEDAIVRYLYGRRLESIAAYDEAIVELEVVRRVGLPSPALVRESGMTLGRVLLWGGRTGRAYDVFRALRESARSPGHRREAADWAERVLTITPTIGIELDSLPVER